MKSGPIYEALKNNKWRDAVGLLSPTAEENPDVAYLLGLIYWNFAKSADANEKAFEWYSRAAKAGHLLAKVETAYIYREGLGVKKKLPVARRLFEECAAEGSIEAVTVLADMYFEGKGGPVNGERAVELLKQAANHPNSGHRLDEFSLLDYDSLADYDSAREQDVVTAAQADLGYLYTDGSAYLPKDSSQAIFWLQKAFDNSEFGAGETLAELYSAQGDLAKARMVLEKLAGKGDEDACFALAKLVESLSESDPREVIRCYQRAVDAGHPDASKQLQRFVAGLKEQEENRFMYLDPKGNFTNSVGLENAADRYFYARSLNVSAQDDWTLKMVARAYMLSFHSGYEAAADGIEQILGMVGADRFKEFMRLEA